MEIKLTEGARKKFSELNFDAIRIYIKAASWSGLILGVISDKKKEDDDYIFCEGYMFVINKGLLRSMPEVITIDYRETGLNRGFKVYL